MSVSVCLALGVGVDECLVVWCAVACRVEGGIQTGSVNGRLRR